MAARITVALLFILTLSLLISASVIIPRGNYNYAKKLMHSGNYSNAASLFETLSDYRDSMELAKESEYRFAQMVLKAGNEKRAMKLFKNLGIYKDSGIYRRFIAAPDLNGARKTIKDYHGIKKIIYVAAKKNYYGLKAGQYVGAYKKVSIKGKTGFKTVIIPSKVIARGSRWKNAVALTFDDSGSNLVKCLNILNKRGVKATFFLAAKELRENPQTWRDAVKKGHQICNHTLSHLLNTHVLPTAKMKKEIIGWETIAKKILGTKYVKRMKRDFPYFRTPGGIATPRLQQVLGDLGYTRTIYWSVESEYFRRHNPRNISIVNHYTAEAKNGAIFLFHGGDYKHLNKIITNIHNKHFKLSLISEIF